MNDSHGRGPATAGAAPVPSAAGCLPAQLPVVCIATGELYGLGDMYVSRLFGMLQRHCPVPFRLHCYSDRPRGLPAEVDLRDCSGWEALQAPGMHPTMRKLGLFNPDFVEFPEFLYLDLSLVIRRDMRDLLEHAFGRPEDLVVVNDWHYPCYNSSVMRVRRGPLRYVYDGFAAGETHAQRVPGDQDHLHAAIRSRGDEGRVACFPAPLVVSYKNAMRVGRRDPARAAHMVDNATIVKFHGAPKMHQAFDPLYYFFRIRLRDLLNGNLREPFSTRALGREWLGEC
ncbi:hypothetical protein [Eleftheria terrae]|uniref:hypothetical protein n=1 Tax=Eleftheria terrae TaxID=1597781 RepID=UPI00263B65E6|nr:hypothetical protein [Eleftheria terrae]WKB54326.1 hypothetical protein N7L95_08045 [Eleftheria terrae]